MNNFFYDESDYSLFKKALKTTENEPVVINILSTDSSLQSPKEKTAESAAVRKNMSKKYEPSPFGKFFGPRKQQAVSVDMSDFSSWKNKNYRKAEESIDDKFGREAKFSMSDFMSEKSKDKFTDIDQTRSDLQKPINQLSTSDPLYKRFSLDSYMHKLEEQTLVKDSFEQNDDILEPLGNDTQLVVPDSSQDENFGFGSNVNVEGVAFDENISGEQFKFEQEELDKFRSRLDKIEREAANIKEKSTEKVLDADALSEIKGEFDISNLTDDESSPEGINVDDVEKINKNLSESSDGQLEDPKSKKTFFEINKTEPTKKRSKGSLISAFDEEETPAESAEAETGEQTDVVETAEQIGDQTEATEIVAPETDAETEEGKSAAVGFGDEHPIPEEMGEGDISEDDGTGSQVVTKDDLKSMTDELVSKFTQMYQKDAGEGQVLPVEPEPVIAPSIPVEPDQTNPLPVDGYVGDPNMFVYPDMNFVSQGTQMSSNETDMLRAQLQELINSNKKLDMESEQRLKEAELEKERVAAEYESRIREMEQSFKQNYEDFKKQAYLDKLDRDIKLKEAEKQFKKKTAKIKEEEKENYTKEKTGAMLRKELRTNLNISNLEMDKKLLEIASTLSKAESEKLEKEKIEMKRQYEEELKAQEPDEVEEIDEVEEVDEEEVKETKKSTTRKSTTRKTTTRKRSPTSRRAPARKGSRRKIDSDIIGGIDFE
ncbi:MAG: hypothetical protein IKD36_01355 [Clostridia bacterium]|nr:hypothetical protein [Clostridia bacterium]